MRKGTTYRLGASRILCDTTTRHVDRGEGGWVVAMAIGLRWLRCLDLRNQLKTWEKWSNSLRPPLRSIESFETRDKWDADSRGVNDVRGSADRIVVQDV